VKTLRRQRIIVRDEIHDALCVDHLKRLLQVAHERLDNRIHARDGVKVINSFEERCTAA
jgi:uncharacterized protein YdcH (DUF465 family)